MRGWPPLKHRLVDRLIPPIGSGQEVFVGTRPLDDGWVASVVRIDGFRREFEAVKLGELIRQDLITHLSFTNQETVPIDAVDVEVGRPEGATFYSLAVFVVLLNFSEAKIFGDFLTEYSKPDR